MMKFLIVGLGNPGKKYALTRHNVGRMILEKIKPPLMNLDGGKPLFFTPSQFMNLSGEEIKPFLRREGLEPNQLIVVHDDIDIPLGEFRLQKNRTSAGHKGVQSIIDVLGSQDFWRLRIGIGRPVESIPLERYVLARLPQKDYNKIQALVPKMIEQLKEIIQSNENN